jgi:hypothetical protein
MLTRAASLRCDHPPATAFVFHERGRPLRHIRAEVPFHHMQGQVDSGCQPARGRDFLVLNKSDPALELHIRKGLREPVIELVMGGCCQWRPQ